MTAIFLAIAIPLAIIIYFMTEVLHIKAAAIPQLRCFDKNTPINIANGVTIPIYKVKPGTKLNDGSIVTSIFKVTSKNLDMFNLHGIIVSESHIVKQNDQWLPVKNHPDAIKLDKYEEPYLYCLNTSNKRIVLNNTIFTDWDEIYDDTLAAILDYKDIKTSENIFKTLDYGFDENTIIKLKDRNVSIKNIQIGDKLSTGGIVYGIVQLTNNLGNNENENENDNLYHLLVSNKYFETLEKKEADYNNIIDSILTSRIKKNII